MGTTASIETQVAIKQDLCMNNTVEIIVSPNKQNIPNHVIEQNNDIRETFEWLIKLLEEKKVS